MLDKYGQIIECDGQTFSITFVIVQLKLDDVDQFPDIQEIGLFHGFDLVLQEFLVMDAGVT